MSSPGFRSGRLIGAIVGVGLLLAAVGLWPTWRFGGRPAVVAMLAGCGVAMIATLVGGLVLGQAAGKVATERATWAMAAMVVRFLAALFVGGLIAFAGWFESGPFLLWLAIGYVALLAVETTFAIRVLGAADSGRE